MTKNERDPNAAYVGDDPELARLVEAGIAGMAKREAAGKRFNDNPAKWAKKRRDARRAEKKR